MDDSIFVFTAGLWRDTAQTFESAVTGAIYLEQCGPGQAQRLTAELLRLLDQHQLWNNQP